MEDLSDALAASSLKATHGIYNLQKLDIFGVTLVTILIFVLLPSSYKYYVGSQRRISDKAQRSATMIKAFEAIERQKERKVSDSREPTRELSSTSMSVSQIFIYPIKSLRGCSVSSATLTREGFAWDRKFVLLRTEDQTHIAISKVPTLALFHTAITHDTITVTFQPPGLPKICSSLVKIPLAPQNFQDLKSLKIDMHKSPTIAYDMGPKYSAWFTERLGFDVVLAYWGGNARQVLGNLPPVPRDLSAITRMMAKVPGIGNWMIPENDVIAFNDCAPFLCITEESVADISNRLEDVEMDITKFRANIVVKGSPAAFDEDRWGELTFGTGAEIILTANCGRCVSLNVNHDTGEMGTGKAGGVLKLMMKDRRIDKGVKYSPIFGRYGFVSRKGEGTVLRIGEKVIVSARNKEDTRFYWPGLST